ncbi:MAG: LysM peptidoglycan-binding domain-containing protein [Victivallaceae bacterium]|nr:LysM peptidoglycan-binding domain-containing protein [Victivallaceae bacterium]
MKEKLWIAAAGILMFAGCKSEVMDQRQYTPAAQAPGVMTPMEPVQPMPRVAPAAPAPVAVQYPPMTGVFSSGGVDSVAGAAGNAGEYVVRQGDTLGKIAAMHRVSLSSLMSANNMSAADAKRLAVGKKLVIPAGGKAVAPAKTNSAKKSGAKKSVSGAPAQTPALNKDGFYEIQSGDTIGKIAGRFQVKSSEILKVNNMTEADARRLQIGMKIAIPGKSTALPVADAAAPVVAPEAGAGAVVDAAAPVALVDDPVPVEDEDLSAERTIMIEAEEDISLADFAAKHGTTADELRKFNKGCPDPLRKGDPILVPAKK